MSKWTGADTSEHSGDSRARFHQLSTMRGIMQQALVFLREGTVQKTASASVEATIPAKPQLVFGVPFLAPENKAH